MTRSAPHVVLVGLPGSGKSAVARQVGARTGCTVIELDAEIERLARMPVTDLFARRGEPEFRRLEAEATRRLLSRQEPGLVDAGGGWIANAGARELVPGHWAILYLRVSPAEAASRLGPAAVARPLLADAGTPEGVRERLEQLAAGRVPLYERADEVVETGGRALDEVVREVAGVVERLLGQTGNPDSAEVQVRSPQ